MNPKNTIVLVALEDELPRECLPGFHIEYTGVGKVNAAIKAAQVIERYKPNLIINFGTAGGVTRSVHGLHEVGSFVQRDMDATGLGCVLGETPFDAVKDISFGHEGVICGTGDSFVNGDLPMHADLVDMEAYAIAKACLGAQIDFRCYKYVSDNANDEAGDLWKKNITKGQQAIRKKLLT